MDFWRTHSHWISYFIEKTSFFFFQVGSFQDQKWCKRCIWKKFPSPMLMNFYHDYNFFSSDRAIIADLKIILYMKHLVPTQFFFKPAKVKNPAGLQIKPRHTKSLLRNQLFIVYSYFFICFCLPNFFLYYILSVIPSYNCK